MNYNSMTILAQIPNTHPPEHSEALLSTRARPTTLRRRRTEWLNNVRTLETPKLQSSKVEHVRTLEIAKLSAVVQKVWACKRSTLWLFGGILLPNYTQIGITTGNLIPTAHM